MWWYSYSYYNDRMRVFEINSLSEDYTDKVDFSFVQMR